MFHRGLCRKRGAVNVPLHLLVVILLALCNTLTADHIIVKPTEGSSHDCETDFSPCHTLSYYISNAPSFFNISNTSFEFLPGAHNIRDLEAHNIIVEDVHDIGWHGHTVETTEIVCKNNSMAFIFADVTSLSITNLKFSNCGHYLPSTLSEHVKDSRNRKGRPVRKRGPKFYNSTSAALALANVISLHLENVTIQHSLGYGLFGLNLLGRSKILSCSFLENNIKCNGSVNLTDQQEIPNCIGGNVMLLFLDTSKSQTENIARIINSRIKGGLDYSQRVHQCNNIPQQTSSADSSLQYRANGLGVIMGQQEYRVHVSIEHSNFTRNIGNNNHPAVLFHDSSGVTNNVTVDNCLFEEEGTIMISTIDNQDCWDKKKLCYQNDQTKELLSQNIVTMKSCRFMNGIGTGLAICIEPIHLRYGRFQIISIQECIFQHYSFNNSNGSVIKMEYNYIDKNNNRCPSVKIDIHSCLFSFNEIPSITCLLGNDVYSENNDKTTCPLVVLEDAKFLNNYTPKNSTVTILTNGSEIEVWKYENATNKNGNAIDRVYIINTIFTNNTSEMTAGVLHVERTYFTLQNCAFTSSCGTGLKTLNSVVRVKGINTFVNNRGVLGGGLNLNESRLFLMPYSTTLFTGNQAEYGGGIFAISAKAPKNNKFPTSKKNESWNLCTLSLPTEYYNPLQHRNISVLLEQNSAYYAGDSVFGGDYNECRWVYKCKNKCIYRWEDFGRTIPDYVQVADNRSRSEISSTPTKLCTCTKPQKCDKIQLKAFPGQTFNVSLVALGELNGTTSAVVSGTICKDYTNGTCEHDFKNDIGYGQRMQTLSRNCTNVTYTVNSFEPIEYIEVKINRKETPHIEFTRKHVRHIMFKVKLRPCPAGFEIFNKTGHAPGCKCIDYLQKLKINCNIDEGKVSRPDKKWIGNYQGKDVIVHDRCPFDYCLRGEKHIDLSVPDEQCSYNRSGVLCGECQSNMSLVLGSSNCKQCSNIYLLLILPFSLAGLALVVLLLKCNLTVSTGHINAIIFYANIVQVNKAILFLDQDTADSIFSAFIAWLNLDLGIETCLFENLDMYGKVWLQFVFPIYLWILVGLMIVLANYSKRVIRLIGDNSVPVLATLFLLSYAKLLRTIISSVSFTFIEYENKSYTAVWLLDANIEYFSPKHIALFIVALLFAIGYIVPLTLLVLFAPCLQARSHHKPLRWVNRLKPFLDAYQGPYNDKYRYWTGLMLVVRIILFSMFGANYQTDPSMNSFLILIIITPIGMFVLNKRNLTVYRHQFANVVETISTLNLVILIAINWLLTTTAYRKWFVLRKYVTYISVGITVLLFLVIIIYQISLKLCPRVFVKRRLIKNDEDDTASTEMAESAPTHSEVVLRRRESLIEPLLESEEIK